MKLSNRLKNESIVYLEGYITKKRNRSLPTWKENKIKKLIETKKKTLSQQSWDILENPLFKLAEAEIIREGYTEKYITDGKEKYEIPPEKTMLMMLKIVDTAHQQGQRNILSRYCKGC